MICSTDRNEAAYQTAITDHAEKITRWTNPETPRKLYVCPYRRDGCEIDSDDTKL